MEGTVPEPTNQLAPTDPAHRDFIPFFQKIFTENNYKVVSGPKGPRLCILHRDIRATKKDLFFRSTFDDPIIKKIKTSDGTDKFQVILLQDLLDKKYIDEIDFRYLANKSKDIVKLPASDNWKIIEKA